MRSIAIRTTIITFGIWTCIAGNGAVIASDAEMRVRLSSEAPNKWKELRLQCLSNKGTVVDRAEWPMTSENAAAIETFETHFNGNGTCLRFGSRSTSGETNGFEDIIAYNSDYGFIARRERATDKFSVNYVGHSDARIIDRLQGSYVTFAPLMLHQVAIQELFADTSFRAEKVIGTTKDGRSCAEVAFKCNFSPQKGYLVTEGTIVFEVDRLWAWRSFNMNVQYPDRTVLFHSGTLTLADANDRVLPKSLVHEIRHDKNGPYTYRRLAEYTNSAKGDVDCSQCKLSSVGISEPGIAKTPVRQQTLIIWFNVIALSFGALAVFFWMRKTSTRS